MIKPVDDKEAKKLGLDPIEDEALKVNKKTREELAEAPELKAVWSKFCDYVNNYNFKKNKWSAPILCGYNNNGFDDVIINRIACCKPWGYGPKEEDRIKCSLFHPIHNIDVMKYVWSWTENDASMRSVSLDSVRQWMGISGENAHDAFKDVEDTAKLVISFLKLQRTFSQKIKFKDCFTGKK